MKLQRSYILFYYDGPQVFVCADEYDTNYICVAVDSDDFTSDTSIKRVDAVCAKISLGNLRLVAADRLTVGKYLRTIASKYYAITEKADAHYAAQLLKSAPESHFPSNDFVLDPSTSETEDVVTVSYDANDSKSYVDISEELARLSLRENSLAIRLKMSRNGKLGIEAEHLGAVTSLYTKAFGKIENRLAGDYGQSTLIAEKAMAASFDLYLTSRFDKKKEETLFPIMYQSDAITLQYFNKIFEEGVSNQNSLTQLYRIKGHPLASLKGLLSYIQTQQITVLQQGYSADHKFYSQVEILPTAANRILATILSVKDLETDLSSYDGYFNHADSEKGKWRFVADDGQVFSGHADTQFLRGITIDTVRYKVRIRQEISVDAMGKESAISTIDDIPTSISTDERVEINAD